MTAAALLAAAACTTPKHSSSKVRDAVEPGDELDPAVAQGIGDLFEGLVNQRHPPGTTDVKRAVFLKPHGCAKATFTVAEDLPDAVRVGLFATPGPRDAWVRLSSDTVPATSDLKNNTIGFAVKVLGVPGRKVLAGEEAATTHDFLTQNHHVFFVDTAQEFLEFTQAIFNGSFNQWLAAHPTTGAILNAMKHPVPNVLGSTYWSTTPYRLGEGYAKYKVRPCAPLPEEAAPAPNDKNYLQARLERDTQANGACFELQVQPRVGDEMPLDQATVAWSEETSPPVTVATIKVEPQDLRANAATCENLSFTAWHALPEHRPVGSVNKARGIVYKRLADLRRGRNNVPMTEPE
jgi:hypothetical protein